MWVYIESEKGLYTVGFYGPDDKWHPDSDWPSRTDAGNRCAFLNGQRTYSPAITNGTSTSADRRTTDKVG